MDMDVFSTGLNGHAYNWHWIQWTYTDLALDSMDIHRSSTGFNGHFTELR